MLYNITYCVFLPPEGMRQLSKNIVLIDSTVFLKIIVLDMYTVESQLE